MQLTLLLPFVGFLGLVIPITRAVDHQVTVGGIGILKYDPESVDADPGDTVTFIFKQKNHTVTQSTLDAPCVQTADGFDSGFVPVPDEQTSDFTVARFTVSDTKPVWVYCRQSNHCQQGMVFAINPGDKFDTFKSNAINGNPTSTDSSPPGVVTVTETVTVDGATQTTTYATTTTNAAIPTNSAVNHAITVGTNGELVFSPNSITANVGDTVTFQFTSKNHTVTQSSFADPCTPLAETSVNGLTGFDSGFMPVAADATDLPEFTITVNDTAPIWCYCRQANHCRQGMVFAINAPATGNTFDAYLAKAKGIAPPTASSDSLTVATGSPTGVPPSNPTNNGAAAAHRGAGALAVVVAVLAGSLL